MHGRLENLRSRLVIPFHANSEAVGEKNFAHSSGDGKTFESIP